MNAVEIDTEVTKSQIAGILRKAKIVRYRSEAGGKSVLRDIGRNHATYSGIEITERAHTYNKNAGKNLRPRWIKISEGKFDIDFVSGYNGESYTTSEAVEIRNQALQALLEAGFVQVDGLKFRVAKMVA